MVNMHIADRLIEAIETHKAAASDPEELVRLQEFLCRMVAAGVAKTREYDLPQPDTLGRTTVESFHHKAYQF
jgi:hypothetical protein